MDGICTNCGLAYSPDDRECRQCGQELGGESGGGFLSKLFGRREQAPERSPDVVRPHVVEAKPQRIEIVGPDGERRVYDSMDDVPAADRARLKRAQRLGADAFEKLGDLGDDAVTYRTSTTESSVSITVDGDVQVFDSVDDIPEEFRDRIQQAFDRAEDLGIDMPELPGSDDTA